MARFRTRQKQEEPFVDPATRCTSLICGNRNPHEHGRDCDRCGWEYAVAPGIDCKSRVCRRGRRHEHGIACTASCWCAGRAAA